MEALVTSVLRCCERERERERERDEIFYLGEGKRKSGRIVKI